MPSSLGEASLPLSCTAVGRLEYNSCLEHVVIAVSQCIDHTVLDGLKISFLVPDIVHYLDNSGEHSITEPFLDTLQISESMVLGPFKASEDDHNCTLVTSRGFWKPAETVCICRKHLCASEWPKRPKTSSRHLETGSTGLIPLLRFQSETIHGYLKPWIWANIHPFVPWSTPPFHFPVPLRGFLALKV